MLYGDEALTLKEVEAFVNDDNTPTERLKNMARVRYGYTNSMLNDASRTKVLSILQVSMDNEAYYNQDKEVK